MKMESDLNRFRKIVRGKIKKELRRFISSGDLVARQGNKKVTIPLPRIDIPNFDLALRNRAESDREMGRLAIPLIKANRNRDRGKLEIKKDNIILR